MLDAKRIYKGIRWRVKKLLKPIRKPISKIMKFYHFRIMYPGCYRKYAKQPLDEKKVVFIEVRMPYITDSFELIFNKVASSKEYTAVPHYLRMSFVGRREYVRRCKSMIRDVATAKYVFLNDSSNVLACLPMRKETIVTQLWHACGAFKKFGMSTADLIFGDNRKTLKKYPYHNNYTYVTVSSPEIVWAYEEAMSCENKKGVVVPVGTSRTDVFYMDDRKQKAFNRLYETIPQAKGRKVILYAPTFRGRVANAKAPDRLDIDKMCDRLSDEYVLLIKQHPFIKEKTKINSKSGKFAFDVTSDMNIEDLLFVSDICISDYSSLVFEYSLFERPMLFFAYDLDEYYDWRGFYYDYRDFVPGPIFTDTDSMIAHIENIDSSFDRQQVTEFRNRFMSACDGHATDRILELVFGKKDM